MEEIDILTLFLENNINLHPSVFEELRNKNAKEIERILEEAKKSRPDVLTLEYLKSLDGVSTDGKESSGAFVREEKKGIDVHIGRRQDRGPAEDYESELKIRWGDGKGKKSKEVGLRGFVDYFNYRYDMLAKILRDRDPLRDAATIEWAKSSMYGDVRLIGMINDVRPTKKGHLIIELEDPTGVIPTMILNTEKELLQTAREFVKDEVIGIHGSRSKGGDLIIVREIFFPDVPVKNGLRKSEAPLAMALISDIHVGSAKFIEEDFMKFLRWLRGELGNHKQRELASRVKYLIMCGDLVDGVGIYPEQEGELEIKDIYQQYAKMAEYIEMVPEHIEIVVIPGNHDAARQAEPQPPIMEEFAEQLYADDRIHMAGNPSYIGVHGVEVLAYHGRSLDDVISTIPEMSYSKPDKAMLALVKKRHLAPVYGGKVPLAPESVDQMLISEVPDIFHFGHVHHIGVSSYRGTILVNSGTFQEQTSFQKKLNMMPTPSQVPIVDLQAQRTTIMRFDL